MNLQLQLGSPPVTPLRVVPDRVASSHSDPLWYRSVLFQLLSKLSFDNKCFMSRHSA